MPDIKDLAKKLRIRHQVDPFLTDLMKQLNAAISLEKSNSKLTKAKLDVIAHANKIV